MEEGKTKLGIGCPFGENCSLLLDIEARGKVANSLLKFQNLREIKESCIPLKRQK